MLMIDLDVDEPALHSTPRKQREELQLDVTRGELNVVSVGGLLSLNLPPLLLG